MPQFGAGWCKSLHAARLIRPCVHRTISAGGGQGGVAIAPPIRTCRADFGYHGGMVTPSTSITPLILEKLGEGEMRSLSLVVSIRRSLGQGAFLKGDLSAVVNTALRKLVASGKVVEMDGVYSLARAAAAAKR
jgi:hypothetical protein